MYSQPVHTFVPALSALDWAALLTPIVLAASTLALGGVLARRAYWMGNLLAARASVACAVALSVMLAAVPVAQRSKLATLEFAGGRLRIDGPAQHLDLVMRSGNDVRVEDRVVELITPEASVILPVGARWRYGNLEVDAAYLANEFRGRSKARDRSGRLLTLKQPAPVQH
ncbi:MAG: hypothetical protein IH851_04760 [Armatimonadetes bacterium]|nr:hypothetical protein [Armatimonadota bacterium]